MTITRRPSDTARQSATRERPLTAKLFRDNIPAANFPKQQNRDALVSWQLYSSGRLSGPFLARFEQGDCDCDELACSSRDDGLVWFSGGKKTISGGLQDWVVLAGDEGRLEHHMPQHVNRHPCLDAD